VAALRRQAADAPPDSYSSGTRTDDFRTQIGSDTVRLLAQTVIAAGSECFVGTFRSNVSRSIWYLHDRPSSCVLMQPGSVHNTASTVV
jgi:hypothetical protein